MHDAIIDAMSSKTKDATEYAIWIATDRAVREAIDFKTLDAIRVTTQTATKNMRWGARWGATEAVIGVIFHA